MSPILNQSNTSQDALTAPGSCGNGAGSLEGIQGRCGYGPRLPLMVISPFSKENFVDHTVTDQSSIIRFIEDNWLNGQRIGQGSFDGIASSISQMFDFNERGQERLFLDPNTGEPAR